MERAWVIVCGVVGGGMLLGAGVLSVALMLGAFTTYPKSTGQEVTVGPVIAAPKQKTWKEDVYEAREKFWPMTVEMAKECKRNNPISRKLAKEKWSPRFIEEAGKMEGHRVTWTGEVRGMQGKSLIFEACTKRGEGPFLDLYIKPLPLFPEQAAKFGEGDKVEVEGLVEKTDVEVATAAGAFGEGVIVIVNVRLREYTVRLR